MAVIAVSVLASVGLLSSMVSEQKAAAANQAALQKQVAMAQESASRLINLDRITQAKPYLEQADHYRALAEETEQPGSFYQAALQVGGSSADSVVTALIVLLAVLVDAGSIAAGLLLPAIGLQQKQISIISETTQHQANTLQPQVIQRSRGATEAAPHRTVEEHSRSRIEEHSSCRMETIAGAGDRIAADAAVAVAALEAGRIPKLTTREVGGIIKGTGSHICAVTRQAKALLAA